MILFWREVTPHSFRAARGVGGTGIEPFLVSSVAGTRADRQEKGADRENSAELLKDFASVSA